MKNIFLSLVALKNYNTSMSGLEILGVALILIDIYNRIYG